MKVIIFASNEKQLKEIRKYKNLENKPLIICLKGFLKDLFYSFNFNKYFEIIDYKELIPVSPDKIWNECIKKSISFLKRVINLEINGSKIYKDYLSIREISILEISFINLISAHTEILTNIFYKLEIIELIFNIIIPAKVIILNPIKKWEKTVKLICRIRGIPILEKKRGLNNFFSHNMKSKINIKLLNFELEFPTYFLPYLKKIILLWKYITKKQNCLNQYNKIKKRYDILFYTSSITFFDIIQSIIGKIKADKIITTILLLPLNDRKIKNMAKYSKINYKSFECFLSRDLLRKSRIYYSRIIKNYQIIKKSSHFKKQMYSINKMNIKELLEEELDKIFYTSDVVIKFFLVMEKIFKIFSPKVFLTSNVPLRETRSLIYACKFYKIPVIGIRRGTGGFISEYSLYNTVDRLLVAGNFAKETFINSGVDKQKIIITGLPIFDNLIQKLPEKKLMEKELRKKLSINDNFIIITYLTQTINPYFQNKDKINEINYIYKQIVKFENIFLIIKLHPSEKKTEIYNLFAKSIGLKNYVIIRDEINLSNILLASKIAITKYSTTGFNALIAGCRLIITNFHDEKMKFNFFLENDVAISVKNGNQLNNVLRELVENKIPIDREKIDNFLTNHFFKLDCKSTKRIIEQIYQMIE